MSTNFHSYFSIHTGADSNASASEYSIFDEDNYSSFSSTSVSSVDLTYTSSDGKVRFKEAGIYLAVVDISATVSAQTGISLKMKVNGTAVYTSENLFAIQNADPFSYSFQTLLNISQDDYVEITVVTSNTATVIVENGTSLVLLRSNSDYANLLYTADANAAGAGPAEFTLYDSDNGGTVQSTLSNITYTASTGLLTPSKTRNYLMLSSLMAEVGSNGSVTHKLYANGSAIDDLPGRVTSYDPLELTYGFLKSLTGGQTASARVLGADTVTAQKGTSFTLFDISNNGTDPGAFLSFTCDSVSSDLADGTDICFDSNKWSSYAKTDRVTPIGITYTADGGTFVVEKAGKYFILWTLMLGVADTGLRTISVKKGSTTIYTSPFYMHANLDPMEKTTCLIVDASDGDSFTFVITDGEGKISAGTAISMFKVDEWLLPESVPTEEQIASDFTLNTYKTDLLSVQYKRSGVTPGIQVPFCLGIRGPETLRRQPDSVTGAATNTNNAVIIPEFGDEEVK